MYTREKSIEIGKILLIGLFYENGQMSMTKFIAFFGYFVFAIGSLYLLVNNINWESYAIFASYTGGGGAVLQFANKFIDSKYNTASGSYNMVDDMKEKSTPIDTKSSSSVCNNTIDTDTTKYPPAMNKEDIKKDIGTK